MNIFLVRLEFYEGWNGTQAFVEGFGDILNCWNREVTVDYEAHYYKHRKESAFVIWLKHFDRNVP